MPGAGKTTLGESIASTLDNGKNICVIDTDELIELDTPHGDELLELEKLHDGDSDVYDKRWREIFLAEIQRAIDSAQSKQMRIIVFVGILDHFGHGRTPITIDPATHRFYLDVPMDQLICQFYTRYSLMFPSTHLFWKDVVDGHECIPGSTQYITDAGLAKQWHTDHGYTAMSSECIYAQIAQLLK